MVDFPFWCLLFELSGLSPNERNVSFTQEITQNQQQQGAAAAAVVISEQSVEEISSGKNLFILRGLPGSGKTTEAR